MDGDVDVGPLFLRDLEKARGSSRCRALGVGALHLLTFESSENDFDEWPRREGGQKGLLANDAWASDLRREVLDGLDVVVLPDETEVSLQVQPFIRSALNSTVVEVEPVYVDDRAGFLGQK